MSETQTVRVKDDEMRLAEVRREFVAQYVRAGAVLFVLHTLIWLVIILVSQAWGDVNRAGIAVLLYGLTWLPACGYFVTLTLVIRRRTGLLWSIVVPGTSFNLLWLPPFLILAVVFVAAFNIPDSSVSLITILAFCCSAYGVHWVLGKLLAYHERVEVVAYGKHWLTLAYVTWRDILLFRIPHERA